MRAPRPPKHEVPQKRSDHLANSSPAVVHPGVFPMHRLLCLAGALCLLVPLTAFPVIEAQTQVPPPFLVVRQIRATGPVSGYASDGTNGCTMGGSTHVNILEQWTGAPGVPRAELDVWMVQAYDEPDSGTFGTACSVAPAAITDVRYTVNCATGSLFAEANAPMRHLEISSTSAVCGSLVVIEAAGAEVLAVTSAAASPTSTIAACAGTVNVQLATGTTLPLPGVRVGPQACDLSNPPCDAYTGKPGVVSCIGNPIGCCRAFYEHQTATPEIACLRSSVVHLDANLDGIPEFEQDIVVLDAAPCP